MDKTNTTLFEKSCGVIVVWVWRWYGVGVVWAKVVSCVPPYVLLAYCVVTRSAFRGPYADWITGNDL